MNGSKSVIRVLVGLFCLMFWYMLSAQPAVSNVQASQRTDGSMIVDITYDLSGGGEDGLYIFVEVSPDGGAAWRRPGNISGAAGPGIMNGSNLEIAWDSGTDKPDEYWLNCLVKITAEENMIIMLPENVRLELVRIASGSFVMGSPDDELDRWTDEGPQRTVNIGYDFYLGKFTVTKAQWEAVMETSPWEGLNNIIDHPDSPAVYVSWDDIRGTNGFLDKINAHLAATEQEYTVRLPTEAEWEYSARAGTATRFYWGDDPGYMQIEDYAWYRNNAWSIGNPYAHIAGLKIPNIWGLYDMTGNVSEWCEDDYHDSYTGAPADGSAWVVSPRETNRVVRGGNYLSYGPSCRSASRSRKTADSSSSQHGFRVVVLTK